MQIRKMAKADKTAVIDMMRTFYASPALITHGSEEIFVSNVENCLSASPYLEGYVFEEEEGAGVCGYGMLAKSFSTEFGKPCVWIEDLYLRPEARGKGYGTAFLLFVRREYADKLIRLEVESGNEKALGVYKKCGFSPLPYVELVANEKTE